MSFSLARIATKDRQQLRGTVAFSNHTLALSPVYVDVGKLSPRKNNGYFPNMQPLFLVEVHTIGQMVNLRRHVDFHDGRHIVGLGTWGELVVNTIRLGLGTTAIAGEERVGAVGTMVKLIRERCGEAIPD